jgi:hypothetical protein
VGCVFSSHVPLVYALRLESDAEKSLFSIVVDYTTAFGERVQISLSERGMGPWALGCSVSLGTVIAVVLPYDPPLFVGLMKGDARLYLQAAMARRTVRLISLSSLRRIT